MHRPISSHLRSAGGARTADFNLGRGYESSERATEDWDAMPATALYGRNGCSDLEPSASSGPIATSTDRDGEALAEDGCCNDDHLRKAELVIAPLLQADD